MKNLLYVLCLVTLLSCSRLAVLRPIPSKTLPANTTFKTFAKNVKYAGAERGWIISNGKKKNTLKAILNVRQHELVILLTYNKDSYAIDYISSQHMQYNGSHIHRKYYYWVDNLVREINSEFIRDSID